MIREDYDSLKHELYKAREYYTTYLICAFGWTNYIDVWAEVRRIMKSKEVK